MRAYMIVSLIIIPFAGCSSDAGEGSAETLHEDSISIDEDASGTTEEPTEALPEPECEVPSDCDDFVDCTDDYCQSGGCRNVPNVEYCDDSNWCTIPICNPEGNFQGGCEFKSRPCDDNNPCTTNECEPSIGCINETDWSKCDDGNACTQDICEQSGCQHLPTNCDDGKLDTVDGCNANTGCYHFQIECAEGFECVHSDPCIIGHCTPDYTCQYTQKTCDDGVTCTFDSCKGGECTFVPQPFACPDDDTLCTERSCDLNYGCGFVNVICDDGKPYTNDFCDPMVGCKFQVIEGYCENANQCENGDLCTIAVCNPDNTCSYVPIICDDNVDCTIDYCIYGVCANEPDDSMCPDGKCNSTTGCAECDVWMDCPSEDACTNIYCIGGECVTTYTCDPNEYCDPNWGCKPESTCVVDEDCLVPDDIEPCTQFVCVEGACMTEPLTCWDGNQCVIGVCDPKIGDCMFTPEPDGTMCDDENPYTFVDECDSGVCQGKAVENPCADQEYIGCDQCSVVDGICKNLFDSVDVQLCVSFESVVTGDDLYYCIHSTDLKNGVGFVCKHGPVDALVLIKGSPSQSGVFKEEELHYFSGASLIDILSFKEDSAPVFDVDECACIDGEGTLRILEIISSDENVVNARCKAWP